MGETRVWPPWGNIPLSAAPCQGMSRLLAQYDALLKGETEAQRGQQSKRM